MRQIEILAPAGSYEGLTAAINASCDAVYIGGNKFGARAYADNLTEETMLQAIDYAHIHDKKIYMTVNTLFKNSEIENDLYKYLVKYYEQGLDAVIVQDIGVLHFIHEHFPDLAIHASTQMTLTMAQGAETLKKMGITRLVNARELGLEEIRTLRANTDLEIESFVHGALCYCYSGQCLMSSMFGERSGNRGRCAQPCRMPYQLKGDNKNLMAQDEKYILSPKDICTIDMIPELIESGIDSFKIEGRMKRPEYAAGVSNTYRKYVDKYYTLGKERYEAYLSDHKEEFRLDVMLLQDLYNRGGFTQGYYANRNGKAMISINRPNHSGVHVGKVRSVKDNQAQIQLIEDINAQDILEIRETSDGLYDFTVKNDENKGKNYSINLKYGSSVRAGNSVYRTKNDQLLEHMSERFIKLEKKELIFGLLTINVFENIKLKLSCRDISIQIEGDLVEEAKNQPMTEDKIRKQMMKTNETSFAFEELSIVINGSVFIPVQRLNELRREGIVALSEAIVRTHLRASIEKNDNTSNQNKKIGKNNQFGVDINSYKPGICTEITTEQQLKAACGQEEVSSIYIYSDIVPLTRLLELTRYIKQSGKKSYIVLPHIFRISSYELFLQNKKILQDDTIDGYIIRNYEEYEFVLKELDFLTLGKEVITDYNLYVMNRQAVMAWEELGVKQYTSPVELNYYELKELSGIYYDIIVYGKIPIMVSAQCLIKTATGGNNNNYCKTNDAPCCGNGINQVELIDRYQKSFQVKRHCRDCYNTIYNSQYLSLLHNSNEVKELKPTNIRLNFTCESAEETKKIIQSFVQTYLYDNQRIDEIKDFTRGHFKRGVE